MPQIGQFTRENSGFGGRIHTFTIYREVTIVPAEPSDAENAPDYRVHHGDVEGPEIGAGWKRTGERAGEFIALVIDDPALPQPIRANLFRDDDAGNAWSLHWSRPAIASAARELLNKSDNERSGVLSTAMSFLGLYRDPVVAEVTRRCDWRIACNLPSEDAIDRDIRVAVFDGGVKADGKLNPWVNRKKTKNIGAPVEEFQNHGTAVTSALLFGPLQDGITADRPYAKVDHYRVLDEDTMKDDQQELYTVLERIQDVLETRPKYDFVNLSLGPDLPVEDNDVHAWTAVLDQLFADGQTLPTVAVGNSGEMDWISGNARIQTPADCVNGLSVGGCDRSGPGWKRAPYSSIGPGRSPGIMKPDGLAFGGSSREPYWVLNAQDPGAAMPITGTSFAAPTALRTAIGVKAHFGQLLTPLAVKALLLHGANDGGFDKAEVGWGRLGGRHDRRPHQLHPPNETPGGSPMIRIRFRARRLAIALLAAPMALAPMLATSAHAQWVVFDPSNYAQNVLTAARSLQQITNQITSLQNQAQMLINQARNLASLPYSSLQQLQQSVQKTQQLLNQAQNIAYNVQQIDQAFQQKYANVSMSASDAQLITDAKTRWQNTVGGLQDAKRLNSRRTDGA